MKKRGKFLLGALFGAGLGVLFAPKKGSETREELKIKLNDLIGKAKEIDIKEVTEVIEKKIDELREELNDLDREKVLKYAKEKAVLIKEKAQELVDLAIKEGTPLLRETALEVKTKAIQVAKETINRLEENEKKENNK